MLAEKLVSALSDMTETELRIMRGELSRLEVSHAFEHEGTRQAIRLLIYVIGTLIFRT